MTPSVKDLPKIPSKFFLKDQPQIDEALAEAASGALKDFRKDAMYFIEQLVQEIVESLPVTSSIGRGLSCFSADILVGGDEEFIFKAFGQFVKQLQQVGRLSALQVEDATNEFKSFVVEVRCAPNNPCVSEIKDSLAFILSFPSVFAKKSLLTVSVSDMYIKIFFLYKDVFFLFVSSFSSFLLFFIFFVVCRLFVLPV